MSDKKHKAFTRQMRNMGRHALIEEHAKRHAPKPPTPVEAVATPVAQPSPEETLDADIRKKRL